MEQSVPQILILIGPNGVGKTTIGQMLVDIFSCKFIGIETFFMARYCSYQEYRLHREEGYAEFEKKIREAVVNSNEETIVFEEAGASDISFKLISNLQQDYRVALVDVLVSEQACVERVHSQGTTANFPKTEASVIAVRNRHLQEIVLRYNFDLTIENENLSLKEVQEQFQHLLIKR